MFARCQHYGIFADNSGVLHQQSVRVPLVGGFTDLYVQLSDSNSAHDSALWNLILDVSSRRD